MGCGSSKKVNQAEELRNFALANHLYYVLGITPVSDDVVRYVAHLRSEGFDSPDDLDKLTIATLEAKPFFFKKGHLMRIEESRKNKELKDPDTSKEADANGKRLPIDQVNERAKHADEECNTTLAAHISAILGIKPASADVRGYVIALRAEGFDTPDDLDNLAIEKLEAFSFKEGHV